MMNMGSRKEARASVSQVPPGRSHLSEDSPSLSATAWGLWGKCFRLIQEWEVPRPPHRVLAGSIFIVSGVSLYRLHDSRLCFLCFWFQLNFMVLGRCAFMIGFRIWLCYLLLWLFCFQDCSLWRWWSRWTKLCMLSFWADYSLNISQGLVCW